ncbi:hypothetical protein MARI_33900 (plasmid) [Marinobacter sp. JH2]|nr:hypothetical protein [Marinobacter sp. JH2]QBM19244.1 hypothetical protein MARI_33900 [Marinobacter sp. JH2]
MEAYEYRGIPVNPELPEGFDDTPNDERPESHDEWWYRPYIIEEYWSDVAESWNEYKVRLARHGFRPDYTETEWGEMQAQAQSEFLENWPNGRFTVRSLNGGAWDRSTMIGVYSSLDEAADVAADLAQDDGPTLGPSF